MRFWGAILCALWCLAAGIVIGVRVQDGRAFDTDIQNILPSNALEPVIRAAIADAAGTASRRVVVSVSGPDQVRAEAAAADLARAFSDTGAFSSDLAEGALVGQWLFANRNALICETDPARFEHGLQHGVRHLFQRLRGEAGDTHGRLDGLNRAGFPAQHGIAVQPDRIDGRESRRLGHNATSLMHPATGFRNSGDGCSSRATQSGAPVGTGGDQGRAIPPDNGQVTPCLPECTHVLPALPNRAPPRSTCTRPGADQE